jgi:hypothetical protein
MEKPAAACQMMLEENMLAAVEIADVRLVHDVS